jgi:hypothetical protein
MEELTMFNIGQLFNDAPINTIEMKWTACIILELDFNQKRDEIDLLSNVVIYHSTDSPLIMQLWNNLVNNKNYSREGSVDSNLWTDYRFMYIYTI